MISDFVLVFSNFFFGGSVVGWWDSEWIEWPGSLDQHVTLMGDVPSFSLLEFESSRVQLTKFHIYRQDKIKESTFFASNRNFSVAEYLETFRYALQDTVGLMIYFIKLTIEGPLLILISGTRKMRSLFRRIGEFLIVRPSEFDTRWIKMTPISGSIPLPEKSLAFKSFLWTTTNVCSSTRVKRWPYMFDYFHHGLYLPTRTRKEASPNRHPEDHQVQDCKVVGRVFCLYESSGWLSGEKRVTSCTGIVVSSTPSWLHSTPCNLQPEMTVQIPCLYSRPVTSVQGLRLRRTSSCHSCPDVAFELQPLEKWVDTVESFKIHGMERN